MNIEEYEFSDRQVKLQSQSRQNVLWFFNDNDEIFLAKRDVIALAKHFQLTADDLIKE